MIRVCNKTISNTKYKLNSVVCHKGDRGKGHYYSYCLKETGISDRWFLFNDSEVIYIDDLLEEIKKESIYMLFYQLY